VRISEAAEVWSRKVFLATMIAVVAGLSLLGVVVGYLKLLQQK
jgi:hypothetical protein